MTTNFNAGLDSSDVELSYRKEIDWAVKPVGNFKKLRFTGEGFSENKSRSRPEEIRSDGQMSHAITQQVEASGNIDFAFSYETFDDLLAGLLMGAWETPINISNATLIVTAKTVNAAAKITGTTSDVFQTLKVGQWIRTFGFTNSVNNGIFRVSNILNANKTIDLIGGNSASMVTEAVSNTDKKIKGTNLRNGVITDTFHFQKMLASNLWLVYAGAYVTGGSLNAEVGDFMNGSFEFLCKSEAKAVASQSATVDDAPDGRVIDTVAGVSSLEQDGEAIDGVIQGITLDVSKDNARGQYGIGSPDAQGMARGTFGVAGSMSSYFKDFTLYDLYKDETDVLISFFALDDDDQGYIITIPGATLMNPEIVAGSADTDIIADFELEGNPRELKDGEGSFTLQIDKIPAS